MFVSRVITLFTKSECSLCDTAKYVLTRVQTRVPFKLEEVDITGSGNQKWFELYKYDIPVIHLDGAEISRHKISERVLLDALQSSTSSTPTPS